MKKAVAITLGVLAIMCIVVVFPQLTTWRETLRIGGSTTVLSIAQECARLLIEKNNELGISVSGGGSGHGIRAVGVGEIDIGMTSRDVKTEEMEMYPNLTAEVIGIDAVAIVVNPSNPVVELRMENVSKIFSGEIKNWNGVGGNDAPIHLITREEGSGTRDTFEKYVMELYGREIAGAALVKPSSGEIRATVSANVNSIGYISLGYADETVKTVKINGVEATVENVRLGSYAIVRNLYLITNGEPSELEQQFIDFVLSSEGQKVVEDMGYMPVS